MHSIKTTFLKREMLLEFMSCVSVTFIQKKHMKRTVSVRLHNAGSPYAMFAYSALKENTGQKCSTVSTAF